MISDRHHSTNTAINFTASDITMIMNLSSSIFESIQRVNTHCLTGHLAPRVSAIPVRKLHPSTQIRLFSDGKHIPLEPYFCSFSVRQDPVQNITRSSTSTRSTTSTCHIIIAQIYHFPKFQIACN